jgi:hypothetical protein
MIDFVNTLLRPLNLFIIKKRKYDALVREKTVLEKLIDVVTRPNDRKHERLTECVVFSMDRALQLHALLCSYFEKVDHPVPMYILYRASTPDHQKAYEEVFALFKERDLKAVFQENKESFKQQLLDILSSIQTNNVFFLVDDDLFIEHIDMADFARIDTRCSIITLRMGANLLRSYTVQIDQRLPEFAHPKDHEGDKLYWIWSSGEHDWGYPLSVDGHLFSTAEMRVLATHTNYSSPNTFEANLQVYARYFMHRYGICYKKAKLVNIPINKVQSDNDNIHGTIHQDYLLEQWSRGLQMDYRALYGLVNESAHQEVPVTFIERR